MNWIQRLFCGKLISRLSRELAQWEEVATDHANLVGLAKETIQKKDARIVALESDLQSMSELSDKYNALVEEHTKFVEATAKKKATKPRTKKANNEG